MGTRSLTVFKDADWSGDDGKVKKGKEICVMYRQMDGYPEGHGQELAEFLKDMYLVNGLPMGDKRRLANGMECLTGQVIAHFKSGAGGIYIHPAKTRDCWEEYIYTITGNGEKPIIECAEALKKKKKKVLFTGTAEELLNWISDLKKEE